MAAVARKSGREASDRTVNQGVLYISYDGVLEPLGQSQVVAYLEKLAAGRRIHLISFEKPRDWVDRARREAMRERLRRAGIGWHPLRYHKSPSAPATAFDIAAGSALAATLALRHKISIVHARSYVPGLMALAVKRLTGAQFLFDMRGLWADERVDGGLWPRGGTLYRAAKGLERKFLLAADQVVTLTHASESEIRRFDYLTARAPPIAVIPTCANLERFTIRGPLQCDPFVLGYVGSVGTWYLLNEMLRCFLILRELVPRARLFIVNRGEHERIAAQAAAIGIAPEEIELVKAAHSKVPSLVAGMSAGLAFIKPAYSKIASAPTKLAEYLGCGIPVLGNTNVGDVEEVLEGNDVGVAVPGFSDEQLRLGVHRIIELTKQSGIQERCRTTALQLFSLEKGVEAYDSIYEHLATGASDRG